MRIPENFFDVEFPKAMGGYKPDSVDEFISKATDIIKAQQEEIETLRKKMSVLVESVEKYREEEDSLRAALLGAQKLGDSIVKDSRSKAELIIRDATVEANHIVQDAHTQLTREKMELARVQTEATRFRESLLDLYRKHIEVIKNIPHIEEPVYSQDPASVKEEPVSVAAEEPVQTVEPLARTQPAEAAPRAAASVPELHFEEENAETVPEREYDRKVKQIISKQPARSVYSEADFEDDDDDAVEAPVKRTVVSSKFGVLKFGDGFDLEDDDEGSGYRK